MRSILTWRTKRWPRDCGDFVHIVNRNSGVGRIDGQRLTAPCHKASTCSTKTKVFYSDVLCNQGGCFQNGSRKGCRRLVSARRGNKVDVQADRKLSNNISGPLNRCRSRRWDIGCVSRVPAVMAASPMVMFLKRYRPRLSYSPSSDALAPRSAFSYLFVCDHGKASFGM